VVLAPAAIAGLALVFVCLSLLCFYFAYAHTFAPLIEKIAQLFDAVGTPSILGHRISLAFVARALRAFSRELEHGIVYLIQQTEGGLVALWHYMAYSVEQIGGAIAELASETERALIHARRVLIPALIGATYGPLALLVYGLRGQIADLVKTVANIAEHPGRVIEHTITRVKVIEHTVTKVATRTVPAVVAKAVAIPWPAIHSLERRETALERWVRAHVKDIGRVSVGAVAGVALGTLGLGWTRCSKVGRLGKAVCGMNESIIDDLLAGALVVAGTISIVELAKECQAFTPTVDEGLRFFVRELR